MYKLILSDTTYCTLIRDFIFDTKAEFCAFICAQIEAKEFTHFVLCLRNLEIHISDRDSLQGLFTVGIATFTVTNGNQKQYAPIELYRFGSEAEYKSFIND